LDENCNYSVAPCHPEVTRECRERASRERNAEQRCRGRDRQADRTPPNPRRHHGDRAGGATSTGRRLL